MKVKIFKPNRYAGATVNHPQFETTEAGEVVELVDGLERSIFAMKQIFHRAEQALAPLEHAKSLAEVLYVDQRHGGGTGFEA